MRPWLWLILAATAAGATGPDLMVSGHGCDGGFVCGWDGGICRPWSLESRLDSSGGSILCFEKKREVYLGHPLSPVGNLGFRLGWTLPDPQPILSPLTAGGILSASIFGNDTVLAGRFNDTFLLKKEEVYTALPKEFSPKDCGRVTYANGSTVYLGGCFSYYSNISVHGLVSTNANWTDVTPLSGVRMTDNSTGTILALASIDGTLYVGGEFSRTSSGEKTSAGATVVVAGLTAIDIAPPPESTAPTQDTPESDTTDSIEPDYHVVHPYPKLISGVVHALASYGGRLFVGGTNLCVFISNTERCGSIFSYTKGSWGMVGTGLQDTVRTLTFDHSFLYAGGSFGGHLKRIDVHPPASTTADWTVVPFESPVSEVTALANCAAAPTCGVNEELWDGECVCMKGYHQKPCVVDNAYCNPIPAPVNGTVGTCGNGGKLGSVCSIACDPGFEVLGHDRDCRVQHKEHGLWGWGAQRCIPIRDCTTIQPWESNLGYNVGAVVQHSRWIYTAKESSQNNNPSSSNRWTADWTTRCSADPVGITCAGVDNFQANHQYGSNDHVIHDHKKYKAVQATSSPPPSNGWEFVGFCKPCSERGTVVNGTCVCNGYSGDACQTPVPDYCPALPTPASAISTCTAKPVGETCTFNCSGNFAQLVCTVHNSTMGAWSGNLPVCTAAPDTTAPPPTTAADTTQPTTTAASTVPLTDCTDFQPWTIDIHLSANDFVTYSDRKYKVKNNGNSGLFFNFVDYTLQGPINCTYPGQSCSGIVSWASGTSTQSNAYRKHKGVKYRARSNTMREPPTADWNFQFFCTAATS